ncbi:MAG: hypothetical protein CR974_01195 [Gammaproteobacteria bacterium]|nr:MAG: hypothetical protein CR974_01195 [Gammaproteobacteria bacterium]
MRSLITLITTVLLLSGCGFALRGTAIPLPERFTQTYFKDSLGINNRFERRLRQQIELGGGQLVDEEQAKVSITVSPIKERSRQMALSSNGYAKEYERTYSTTITVVNLKTGVQLGNRTVTSVQNLQLDDRHVLAGEEESDTIRDIAEQELVRQMMQYLKTL